MKFGVVVFPGSNCDRDCFHAASHVVGQEVVYLWHKERDLQGVDCIVFPGGFSYGDYLRAGAIASRSPIVNEIADFAAKGGLVIGICNGFQVLTEMQLLPGALMRNKGLTFVCKDVFLKVENNKGPFTTKYGLGDLLRIPIAHMDGNYFASDDVVKELYDNNQVVFRYCDNKGAVLEEVNPNGSIENIAGICNKQGNVLGMMPHPERLSEDILGGTDGRPLFESIVGFINKG